MGRQMRRTSSNSSILFAGLGRKIGRRPGPRAATVAGTSYWREKAEEYSLLATANDGESAEMYKKLADAFAAAAAKAEEREVVPGETTTFLTRAPR